MLSWMERAELELENDLAAGIIDDAEFREGLRDIAAEYEEQRQDAAREAYENY